MIDDRVDSDVGQKLDQVAPPSLVCHMSVENSLAAVDAVGIAGIAPMTVAVATHDCSVGHEAAIVCALEAPGLPSGVADHGKTKVDHVFPPSSVRRNTDRDTVASDACSASARFFDVIVVISWSLGTWPKAKHVSELKHVSCVKNPVSPEMEESSDGSSPVTGRRGTESSLQCAPESCVMRSSCGRTLSQPFGRPGSRPPCRSSRLGRSAWC